MIRKIINFAIYCMFGWGLIQSTWDAFFGYSWRGWFLGLIRYRAIYMVKPGETVILGGVFSERYVEDYANVVGERGKVIVIEANPENVQRLKEKFVDLEQVIFVNQAIWKNRGRIEFLSATPGQAQGYNRVINDGIAAFPDHIVQSVKKITVEASSLDNIRDDLNLETVHQINLTINGAELPALEGFKRILRDSPNIRLYINSEYPYPGNLVIAGIEQLGLKAFKSKLITTKNKRIELIRIYAFGQEG